MLKDEVVACSLGLWPLQQIAQVEALLQSWIGRPGTFDRGRCQIQSVGIHAFFSQHGHIVPHAAAGNQGPACRCVFGHPFS